MARILSLGSALQDIYFIDRDDFAGESYFTHLSIGSKVDIDRVLYFVGGGGTNAAVTFARSGHEAYFMGNLGADGAGTMILRELAKEKVNTDYVVTLPRKPDWLYATTLRGDFVTLRKFFVAAKKCGAKIMFNPGKLELAHPQRTLNLLQFVDVLLVNRCEAAQLVQGSSPLELLERLKNYAPTVIITNDSIGSVAITREMRNGETRYRGYQLPIYTTPHVRDTTGAGDAFGSGFLAAWAHGKTFRQSLVFAAANASAVIQKLGAKAGILAGDAELRPMLVAPIKGLNREKKHAN